VLEHGDASGQSLAVGHEIMHFGGEALGLGFVVRLDFGHTRRDRRNRGRRRAQFGDDAHRIAEIVDRKLQPLAACFGLAGEYNGRECDTGRAAPAQDPRKLARFADTGQIRFRRRDLCRHGQPLRGRITSLKTLAESGNARCHKDRSTPCFATAAPY